MYLSLLESFALWLESRGKSRKDAVFHAGAAFSLYTLIALTSIAVLLTVVAGIPVMDWVSSHDWSIWLAGALIALVHWQVARLLNRSTRHVEESRPSLRLWYWYVIPVLGLLIGTIMLAVVYTTH